MPDEKELSEMSPDEIAAAAELEAAKGEEIEKKEEKPVVVAQPNLEEVVAKLAETLRPGMTEAQKEEQIKKVESESGFDRKQLGWMTKALSDTAVNQNLALSQEVGRGRADKALGNYSEALLSQVEAEMKKQAPSVQANPEAWTQMAYLIKGKMSDSVKPSVKKTVVAGAGDEGGDKLKGLTNGGGGGAGSGKKTVVKYSEDEQLMIKTYFKGNSEEYESSKSKKSGSVRMIAENERGNNTADKEYMRLTGGQLA